MVFTNYDTSFFLDLLSLLYSRVVLFFHDGLEVNKVVVTRLLFYAHTSYHIKLTVLITVQFFKLRFAYRQIYPLIRWFIWFGERSFL